MIHPKVKAGAQAGGVISALATVIAWLATQYHVDMPLPVAVAISSLLISAAHFVAGYLKAG